MDYALKVQNLCKVYENTDFKLDNVTFSIPKGSILGFVGKNGAGKSSTINSILNIIKKDSGTVKFFGYDMTDDATSIKEDIGVVFDSINFHEDLTARNIEKILSDIYTNWDKDLFFSYLEKFKIPSNKKIKTFSRGMTMKLSISIALSHKAKLLILDEATSGLDPVVREEILDTFLDFVEDENNSILISSHISSDLEKIADYIAVIDNGKVILNESKDTLIYDYGIARMKRNDFDKLEKSEYISYRQRGLQIEVLISDKIRFSQKYPNITLDVTSIDEILPLITKGA
ncbi:ABC-2 type transport system ATP-binding protein [Clostridium collagenovorans DSM 3089]|uniref:ABC-2 type transport system ATP-binding protein n=1 Tax=Clostridium collagenovorans DSM 3089 TaxID=1121306 RepID=A0A1M5S4B7_9CLOT|nr:ABC transporter ATP-binding protein [Clostridium collagenovorans]SHH33437.1 ABC-2 type transport system ATP-binding protein [Clostridium collagenovorans DSM 3089]